MSNDPVCMIYSFGGVLWRSPNSIGNSYIPMLTSVIETQARTPRENKNKRFQYYEYEPMMLLLLDDYSADELGPICGSSMDELAAELAVEECSVN